MDTSEIYIKMCEKAAEITGKWNPFCRGQNDYWWAEVESDLNARGICMKIAEWGAHTKYVWLPRQDQLQEMVGGRNALGGFTWWVYHTEKRIAGEAIIPNDYSEQFNSMEQLWLAFVMKEKYNKVWTGNAWH